MMNTPQKRNPSAWRTTMLLFVVAISAFFLGVSVGTQESELSGMNAQSSLGKKAERDNRRFTVDELIGRTIDGKTIYLHDEKIFVWANGHPNNNLTEWFDMTDSTINPVELKHGIGKDKIPAIDKPTFLKPDDPKLKLWVSRELDVIGVVINGEARAYPVGFMNQHELVNDTFGEAHVTVAW